MIFQEPMTALNPLIRIGDQVAETVRLHRASGAAEAKEALAWHELIRLRDTTREAIARGHLPLPENNSYRYGKHSNGGSPG